MPVHDVIIIINDGGALGDGGGNAMSGYMIVQVGGAPVTQRQIINFVSGASVVDNSGALRTDVTITGGSAPLNSATMESFGAVGNGVTSDQPAVNAAVAAFAANTIYQLVGSAGQTYLVTSDGDPDFPTAFHIGTTKKRVIGQGDSTVFKTVTNALVFRVTATSSGVEYTTIQDLRIVGNSAGGTSPNSQDGVELGYLGGDGPAQARVINVTCESMGGRGFVAAFSPEIIGPTFIGCKAWHCVDGFYAGGQVSFIGCQANKCTGRGLVAGAGNCNFTGGEIIQCATGIEVIAGDNDGHGEVIGGNVNHCPIAVLTGNLKNGFTFSGVDFYEGAHNHTNVFLEGEKPSEIKYVGCTIDATSYLADGANVVFEDCKFDVAYFFSITEINGGSFRFINPTMVHGGALPSWIGSRVLGTLTFASNSDVFLTRAQSYRNYLAIGVGSESGAVNVISQRAPALGETFYLINNSTHNVNYYWGLADGAVSSGASGAGLVVPPSTAALIGADGTDAIDMGHSSTNLAVAPPIGGVDPTTLPLTGYYRDFDGGNWEGVASAGTSGAKTATAAGGGPTMGTPVDGHVPAVFDGTTYFSDTGGMPAYVGGGAYRCWFLVKWTSLAADAGSPFNNAGLVSEGNGEFGVTAFTATVQGYHDNGGYGIASGTVATGAWTLVDLRYDGTTGTIAINGVDGTSFTKGPLTGLGAFFLGQMFTHTATKGLIGQMLEAGFCDDDLPSVSPANLVAYVGSYYPSITL